MRPKRLLLLIGVVIVASIIPTDDVVHPADNRQAAHAGRV